MYPLLSQGEWDSLEPSRVRDLGPGDGGDGFRRKSRAFLHVTDAAATTCSASVANGRLTNDAPLVHVLGSHSETDSLYLGLSGEWTFDEIMSAISKMFDCWSTARLYYRWVLVFPPSAGLRPNAWSGIWMDCLEDSWYDRSMQMPRGLAADAFSYGDFWPTAAATRDEFMAVGIEALLVDERKDSGPIEFPDFIDYEGW